MKRLDNEAFKCIIKNTPLVSVDFLVKKNNKYLLGKRINSPAKGYWFTIGGRIFKNETIKEAQKRILKEELNFYLEETLRLNFIGIFEHFYDDSIFGNNISTHYINLAYLIDFDIILQLNDMDSDLPFDQHEEYDWFTENDILKRNDVHKYVKDYFKGSIYV